MKYLKLLVLMICISVFSCKTDKRETNGNTVDVPIESATSENGLNNSDTNGSRIAIHPISHGTLVLEYENVILYIDPVGGAAAFEGQKPPTLIFITDIHGDHLNIETLEAISTADSKIIAPLAVADKLPAGLRNKTSVLPNSQSRNYTIGNAKLTIDAIPMYNLREEALQFHPKNRGNGYVLTLGKERIYISGDTEDIPEMRELKDIDIAFICMNLPYTMTVESAADAVLEFKPKKVYPYHYRGTDGFSDVGKFKSVVNEANSAIEVIQVDWYKKSDEV